MSGLPGMKSKTLREAAAVYCAERAEILRVTRALAKIGDCEVQKPGDDEIGGGVLSCVEALIDDYDGPGRFYKTINSLSDEALAEFCPACRAKAPLWKERHARKKRLAGLMRSMLSAHAREVGEVA